MSHIDIISVHIPKTAGTTFRNLLIQAYGGDQVYCDYPGKYDGPGTASVVETTKVIHGHFPISKYASQFQAAKKIAWLRHPIPLIISHYFYHKKINSDLNNVNKESLGIVEFAEQNKNVIANFLQGVSLKGFYFLGIQEFYREDLLELKSMLSWKDINISRRDNANLFSEYQNTFQEIIGDFNVLQKLTSLNIEDIQLYNEVLNLRAKRRNEPLDIYPIIIGFQWSQMQKIAIQRQLDQTEEKLDYAQQELKKLKSPELKLQLTKNLEEPSDDIFLQKTCHLDDNSFLEATYWTYLNRPPDPNGLDSYLRSLRQGTLRKQVVFSFRNSEEYKKTIKNSGDK